VFGGGDTGAGSLRGSVVRGARVLALVPLVAALLAAVAPAANATLTSTNVAYVFDDTLFPCDNSAGGNGCGVNDSNFLGGSIFTNAVTGNTPGTVGTNTASYTPSGGSQATLTNVPLSTLDSNPRALSGYDTAILYELCNIGASDNQTALSAINSFVSAGGKVMIFDADGCAPSSDGTPDWSRFIFPFATNNPGPQGAPGSYTKVEPSPLTTGLSPGPVDGDAVGDANIFTSSDTRWYQAVEATNTNDVTGTVLAYAHAPSGGLALYSGEDFWNTSAPTAHLQQVFDDMLNQRWSPDNLPSTTPVCTSNCTGPGTNDNGLGAPTPTCPDSSATLPGGITVQASCFTVGKDGELHATGHIRVNGLDVVVGGSGGFTLDTKRLKLDASASVDVYAGSLHIYHGRLRWDFKKKLSLGVPSNLKVKGLPVSGDATVTLAPGGLDVLVNASIGKSSFMVSGAVDLKLTLESGLELDSLQLALSSNVPIKSLLIKKATLSYHHTGSGDVWEGDVAVQLPEKGPLVEGTLTVTNGALSEVTLNVSGINKPLGEVVFLQSLGLKVDFLPALSATGSIGLSAGPAVDGHTAASLDGSLEADIGSPFVLKADGTLSLADQKLASAAVTATIPGGVRFSGNLSASFLVIKLDGQISGDVTSNSFDAEGGITLQAPLVTANGDGLVNNVGIAGCASAKIGVTVFGNFIGKTVTVGGAHRWSGSNSLFSDSCGFSKLKSELGAHIASAGSVRVPRHTRQLNLIVRGVSGPPQVQLTHGTTTALVAPNSTGAFGKTVYLAIADPSDNETDIAIADPPRGALSVGPAPGQPALAGVGSSLPLPGPALHVKLRRVGPRRYRLSWRARRIAGQRLVFESSSPRGIQRLGSSSRLRGALTFTAVDDGTRGARAVQTVVEQDGLVRAILRGPRYRPATVRLAAPHVRVGLRGSRAVITWTRVSGAARYYVSIGTSDGRHLFFAIGKRRPVRVTGAAVVFARVWAVGAGLELGRPGAASAHRKHGRHHRHRR
jgi:hypothetical protein